jgi:hypothetical protein
VNEENEENLNGQNRTIEKKKRSNSISKISNIRRNSINNVRRGSFSNNQLFLPFDVNKNRSSSRNDSSLSFSRERRNSLSFKKNTTLPDLKAIYLKKLHNNYYDRKLWNTLVNLHSQDYNFYIEKTPRDYNDDFNILKQIDRTNSTFFKRCSN